MAKLWLFCSIAAALTFAGFQIAHAAKIITVAGFGAIPNNIPANQATVGAICNMAAVDSAGNLYFSDTERHRVCKVDKVTGIFTVVAGTGEEGYTSDNGDEGLATEAKLDQPYGIAPDSAGNLYIVDSMASVVRKVDASTGIISRVAGKYHLWTYNGDEIPATDALLRIPHDVAVDSGNNFYIADSGNHRIRKIDISTGIITTVAGTGIGGYNEDGISATSANLNYPTGIKFDDEGNLYIADKDNHRVRKVDAVTGKISTVAGTGTAGYSGDGSSAVEAELDIPWEVDLDASGNVYIVDRNNHCIRKVDSATGIISTFAGTGTAGYNGDGIESSTAYLSDPRGVAIGDSGDCFIVDKGNYRIRRVDAGTGLISTFAGTGSLTYNGEGMLATIAQLALPQGVAVDISGNVYVGDTGNSRVRKVDAATGIISNVNDAAWEKPAAVLFDGADNLYVADSGAHRVLRVDGETGLIAVVAGTGTPGYSGDGMDATTAELTMPSGLAFDAEGNLYIADTGNSIIRKVDAISGLISRVAGFPIPYVFDVELYNGDGIDALTAHLSFPMGIALDEAGNLYIADRNNHRLRKVDAVSGLISTVVGTGTKGYNGDGMDAVLAQLNYPSGIVIDDAGNLHIADSGNKRIRVVNAETGLISTIAGGGGYNQDGIDATAAVLSCPTSIALIGTGDFYIADQGLPFSGIAFDKIGHRVRRVVFDIASFSADLAISPVSGQIGNWIEVVLTVTNTGTAGATGVSPSLQVSQGNSLLSYQSGPSPAGNVSLSPGISQSFTWTYSVSGSGYIVFTASVSGMDAGTGYPFSSAVSAAFTLGEPSIPEVSSSLTPYMTIKAKLQAGDLIAAPNVMNLLNGGSVTIYMKGDPNASARVEIYDESGDLIGTLEAPLDAEGFGKVTISGGAIDGKLIGPGIYWARVRGGGVKARKPFVVVTGR